MTFMTEHGKYDFMTFVRKSCDYLCPVYFSKVRSILISRRITICTLYFVLFFSTSHVSVRTIRFHTAIFINFLKSHCF